MPDPEARCLIDSNVWLYAFIEGGDAEKSARARSVVQADDITVSTQVINEVCVNLLRKADFAEEDVRRLVVAFHRRYTVVPLDQATLLRASELREQHSFSFWDSLIVSSAILAGVDVLYSEDMQDGFEIEGTRIVNPSDSFGFAVTRTGRRVLPSLVRLSTDRASSSQTTGAPDVKIILLSAGNLGQWVERGQGDRTFNDPR